MSETIKEGFMVFVSDGEDGIGSVREVSQKPPELVIYIENAGDFVVPMSAVKEVHFDKVILDSTKLDSPLLDAISHARDSEDPDYIASGSNHVN